MHSRVLRSPHLADGGEAHVVRLYEVQTFARGGLALGRGRELTLHLTTPELSRLKKRWGEPRVNVSTKQMEYAMPAGSLKRATKASGGQVGGPEPQTLSSPNEDQPQPPYLRKRSTDEIPDYYTYGMGPEHQFYTNNVVADQPTFVHTPTTPTGPSTQSTGASQATAAGLGAVLGGAGSLADALGYGGTLAKGASTIGNALTGNWAGAAKSGLGLYQSLVAPSMADYASGAALDSALANAGITGDLSSLAAGAGTEAGAGAGAGATAAGEGAATGSTASSSGALAGLTGSGLTAGLTGLGLVAAAAPFLHGNYDNEIRNKAAFEKAFPGINNQYYNRSRGNMAGTVVLPDGTQLNSTEYDNLTNAWYNANFETGQKQTEGKQYLDDFQRREKTGEGFYWANKKNPYVGTTWTPGGARGGALSDIADRHVRGPGTGRSDSIPAQLSDGEYVLTAEDVSLLGDGSNEAGARRLDEFRQQLRKHKGGALARGKISPNALSPLQYMKRVK